MATIVKTTNWIAKHPKTGLDWNRSKTEDIFTGNKKDCLAEMEKISKENKCSVITPTFVRLEDTNISFDIYI